MTAIGVLALPFPIFLWFWFEPAFALPLIAAILFLTVWVGVSLMAAWVGASGAREPVRFATIAWLLLGALVPLVLTGVGGLLHQTSDWVKHNAMLLALLEQPWPPAVATDTQIFQLSYNIAWYLPAIFLGKLAGWTAANFFLLAYSACGLAALIFLSARATGAGLLTVYAVFIAFSGLDALGEFLIGHLTSLSSASLVIQEDEWWAAAFQYSGTVTQLYYVPHQALSGWLVTVLLLIGIRSGLAWPALAFCGPASFLWAPWVTIGLIPIGLYFAVREVFMAAFGKALFPSGRPVPELAAYLSAAAVSFALVVYYSTRFAVAETDFTPPPRGYLEFTPGIDYFSGAKFAMVYALFIAIEIGALLAICLWILRDARDRLFAELLLVAAAVLLVLPAFRYGYFNDLTMRASIPALFLLVLVAAFCLAQQSAAIKRGVLIALLIVCFANVLLVNKQHIERNFTVKWRVLMAFKQEEAQTLQCVHEMRSEQIRLNLLSQYVGKAEWPIQNALLRSPETPPETELKRLPPPSTARDGRIAAACELP